MKIMNLINAFFLNKMNSVTNKIKKITYITLFKI